MKLTAYIAGREIRITPGNRVFASGAAMERWLLANGHTLSNTRGTFRISPECYDSKQESDCSIPLADRLRRR